MLIEVSNVGKVGTFPASVVSYVYSNAGSENNLHISCTGRFTSLLCRPSLFFNRSVFCITVIYSNIETSTCGDNIVNPNPYSVVIEFSLQNLNTDSNVYEVDPHAVRLKIVIMVVDPQHRYSIESERAN